MFCVLINGGIYKKSSTPNEKLEKVFIALSFSMEG